MAPSWALGPLSCLYRIPQRAFLGGGGLSRKFFLASNHILSCCSFVLSCWVLGLLLLPLLLKCQAAPSWLGGVGRLVNLALLVIGGTKAQRGQGPEATQLTGGGVRI